ncbi:peptidyl-prolyl cis-trans isomerase [Striga asiatica]|uniref:Peptidyl-prolyl cis-trans isomerase n=1 Tax=Striga asiatica TaxID=4170 RepID=A0A5A7QAA2_STRAF|nr:peptidyl-prolyl cis-trans isomerase [Striga asiatica]
MELFADVVTKTDENFCALCTNEKDVGKSGKPLHHKGSSFHRIIPNFICQSSDFTAGNDGKSIYNAKFTDENIMRKHIGTCQWRRLTKWLDNKHVVFGQVVEEYDILKAVENVGSGSHRTSRRVICTPNNDQNGNTKKTTTRNILPTQNPSPSSHRTPCHVDSSHWPFPPPMTFPNKQHTPRRHGPRAPRAGNNILRRAT